MFAKHLPPSSGVPRVLALDDWAAADLPKDAECIGPARVRFAPHAPAFAAGIFDAVAGHAPPETAASLARLLRPGGRLILAHPADPKRLLSILAGAGLVHCLVEPHDHVTLYRGERPPAGTSVERIQRLSSDRQSPFSNLQSIFLLVSQTPNKPAWKLEPGEKFEWRATTIPDPATGEPALIAFSSLVKAVAFMQPAVKAGALVGVNKIAKFRADAAKDWQLPVWLNPSFEELRETPLGPPYAVDPNTAVKGEE